MKKSLVTGLAILTLLPQVVAENMEGNIEWDQDTKTINMTGPELPKAKSITVTVEGKKVLEVANPKMVGNTPMIPVGQFVRSVVAARIPEYIKAAEEFRYVYSPASDNQFNSKGLDVYMFGGTQPAEFDGVYFLYSPKYDIFIEPVESPGNVMRTKIHPIAEGDELYLTPDQISHFFWADLTQNSNIYDFSKGYEKWVMVDDVMSTYWPNYTDEKSIQAAYGDLVRKNHDPFGMGPSYYFKNVPLERYLERVVKNMK